MKHKVLKLNNCFPELIYLATQIGNEVATNTIDLCLSDK